jgi:hypothetical protein
MLLRFLRIGGLRLLLLLSMEISLPGSGSGGRPWRSQRSRGEHLKCPDEYSDEIVAACRRAALTVANFPGGECQADGISYNHDSQKDHEECH